MGLGVWRLCRECWGLAPSWRHWDRLVDSNQGNACLRLLERGLNVELSAHLRAITLLDAFALSNPLLDLIVLSEHVLFDR